MKQYIQELINESKQYNVSNIGRLFEIFDQFELLTENVVFDAKFVTAFSKILLSNSKNSLNESIEELTDTFSHLLQNKELMNKVNRKFEENVYLTFEASNSKLSHPGFSILAGVTCPFADLCKTWVVSNVDTDGKETLDIKHKYDNNPNAIACFAAMNSLIFQKYYKKLVSNTDLLKPILTDTGKMRNLILKSINNYERENNTKMNLLRVHNSGDFFNQAYFDAWVEVAQLRPDIILYAYTKSLPYWVKWIERGFDSDEKIPSNFKLIASRGGTQDDLIDKFQLRNAIVVNKPSDAEKLNLPIDITDEIAYNTNSSFALLLHGSGQKGQNYKDSNRNMMLTNAIKMVMKMKMKPDKKLKVIKLMEKWRNEETNEFSPNHGTSFMFRKSNIEPLINSAIDEIENNSTT